MTRLSTRCTRAAPVLLALIASSGCIQLDNYIPAVNCGPPEPLLLTTLAETDGARLAQLVDHEAVLWLEIQDRQADQTIGGYLSREVGARRSLVVLLCGAGTLNDGARRETAFNAHTGYGQNFEQAGYRVWSPVLTEAGVYGGRELDEALVCLRWLHSGGAEWLETPRVYLVGYSTGATTANLANLSADVTAVVSISGLTQPDQLVELAPLYRFITDLFPCNSGLAQFRRSVDACLTHGCAELDVVSRVSGIRNPTLFLHGEGDPIYLPSNLHALESAYVAAQNAGAALPSLLFAYVPGQGHFVYEQPDQVRRALDFLDSFEATDPIE